MPAAAGFVAVAVASDRVVWLDVSALSPVSVSAAATPCPAPSAMHAPAPKAPSQIAHRCDVIGEL
ncbi:hypothetical protein MPRF_09050 [Mycolicibacterium parafortuitum]|uniref:Uncharacterized protein n=1 Tax=Mycolicibacterium parafortuitum TaxID=39692 RepID=A0A7I7U0U8_MYCPF|nr:hypothetical protein MPRF_09050 [Mycolicibacterium parafortuitum]